MSSQQPRRKRRGLKLVASQPPAPEPVSHFTDPESERILEEAADRIAEALGEQMAIEDLIAWGELESR
jgi:hypothetical protein